MSLSEFFVLKHSKAESLDAVRSLNCWGCNLDNVDILDTLVNLEVVNLSCNNLTSLKNLRKCNKLREVYIRKNKLRDISELVNLANLPHLKVVWLSDNPLSKEPDYRDQVTRILPQISTLDNIDVVRAQPVPMLNDVKSESQTPSVLPAVLLLLKELSQLELETVSEVVNSILRQE